MSQPKMSLRLETQVNLMEFKLPELGEGVYEAELSSGVFRQERCRRKRSEPAGSADRQSSAERLPVRRHHRTCSRNRAHPESWRRGSRYQPAGAAQPSPTPASPKPSATTTASASSQNQKQPVLKPLVQSRPKASKIASRERQPAARGCSVTTTFKLPRRFGTWRASWASTWPNCPAAPAGVSCSTI